MTNPAELEFSSQLFQITLTQLKSRPTCADSHSQPKKQPLNYVYSHFQPRPPNCIDSAQIMLLFYLIAMACLGELNLVEAKLLHKSWYLT